MIAMDMALDSGNEGMSQGQGQSLSTLDKERQLAVMFDMNLHIMLWSCPRSIYRHVDLNAALGWNDDFDVPGSPTESKLL